MNIYSSEEIKKIRQSGRILAETLGKLAKKARPGVSLKTLDEMAEELIRRAGAEPAFLGYKPYGAKNGYPSSICASVNEVVVHAVPGPYKLKNGDILTIDLGVKRDGYYADSALSLTIGKVSASAKKLLKATKQALMDAIKQARPGKTLGDIGYAVKKRVTQNGFFVVRGLTGHGIGKDLHEDPNVLNEGQRGQGMKLVSGMVIAIEPMTAIGTPRLIQKEDDSFATADGSLSAHFEHTIAITKKGPEILTK